jgi:hypothetical protein
VQWTKVLAEKDAELAETRDHRREALRLDQEAGAQKDAHLAELADHWTDCWPRKMRSSPRRESNGAKRYA